MAGIAPGIGGAAPAPGRGGTQPGGIGGRSLGGGVYAVPAMLRGGRPPKAPLPYNPNPTLNPDPGNHYWNPYGSVEGFQNYHHPLLKWGRGDVFPGGRPDLTGFPSVSRVQEIANAQKAMAGQSLFAPRTGGTGITAQNPDILALLRERLGLGASY